MVLLMSTHNIYCYRELDLAKVLLMSTHKICFYGELEKIIPQLSPNTLS